jgi:bifunctional enzyme CysN/CysC
VTGASTADLAIILVDARKGILPQTRRQSYIVSLMGIRHIVLAVNKMDLVDYAEETFARIDSAYREFARQIRLEQITCIPISAVHGDNVVTPYGNTPWYHGPCLMEHLETVPVQDDLPSRPFRMPVQWVNRPDSEFRGFAGTIAGGTVRTGDRIRALPSGRESVVARIMGPGHDLETATANQSVTLTLVDEIDISRGDVIAAAADPAEVADQFEATLVWMGDAAMLPGRNYLMKIGTKAVTATVAPLRHKVNVNTLEHIAATKLELNEIGVVQLELDQSIAFEPYERNRDLGGFILIDRLSNNTVGAGMLHFALRRSQNVHWQAVDIDKAARAALKGQKPCVLWFTGLSVSVRRAPS